MTSCMTRLTMGPKSKLTGSSSGSQGKRERPVTVWTGGAGGARRRAIIAAASGSEGAVAAVRRAEAKRTDDRARAETWADGAQAGRVEGNGQAAATRLRGHGEGVWMGGGARGDVKGVT